MKKNSFDPGAFVAAARGAVRASPRRAVALALAALSFCVLFAQPASTLAADWWNRPEAGHGLLLAPLAIWLAVKAGLRPDRRPMIVLGLLMLASAVAVRYLSGLAAEQFTARCAMLLAAGGLVVYFWGLRQLLSWWLPLALLILAIPLPEVVLGALALPLQFKASQLGASMLEWRGIPVLLSGNVIRVPPNHDLFVTEACSGLRSLTALLSLGVLLGGIALRYPVTRVLLLAIAIPIAVLINGVRVFLTGFLVVFVDPKLGEGFVHMTEGWLMFLVAFAALSSLAWVFGRAERRFAAGGAHA